VCEREREREGGKEGEGKRRRKQVRWSTTQVASHTPVNDTLLMKVREAEENLRNIVRDKTLRELATEFGAK